MQSIESVLKSVRGEIATGYGPNGEDLDYIQLSAQLSFAVGPLKRMGHDALAEEVMLVKQTIEKLATVAVRKPPDPVTSEKAPPTVNNQESMPLPTMASSARRDSDGNASHFSHLHLVLIVAGLSLVVAAGGWFLFSGGDDDDIQEDGVGDSVVLEATAIPAAIDATEPVSSLDFERFWDLVGEAKLAIQKGEAESAISALDLAAAMTRDKSEIFKTAELIKQRFTAMALIAIEDRNWEYGDALLARAIDVAADYSLTTVEIDRVVDDLEEIEWEYRISPDDVGSTLIKLVGTETVVELADGSAQIGIVREISNGQLILDGRETMGGGAMGFTAEIALDTIRYIRYTGQPNLVAVQAARDRSAKLNTLL